MERQFLTVSLLFLFALSSCQTNQSVTKILDDPCNSMPLDTVCVDEIIPKIDKPEPIIENVWDYMIVNNYYDKTIAIDERTQGYINNPVSYTHLTLPTKA